MREQLYYRPVIESMFANSKETVLSPGLRNVQNQKRNEIVWAPTVTIFSVCWGKVYFYRSVLQVLVVAKISFYGIKAIDECMSQL